VAKAEFIRQTRMKKEGNGDVAMIPLNVTTNIRILGYQLALRWIIPGIRIF